MIIPLSLSIRSDFTEAKSCESLYNTTYHLVRQFLTHVKDLLIYLRNGNFTESNRYLYIQILLIFMLNVLILF